MFKTLLVRAWVFNKVVWDWVQEVKLICKTVLVKAWAFNKVVWGWLQEV